VKPVKSADISIITVVKDDAIGLSQTASSITRQTVAAKEWIILDGESDPSTLELLNKLDKIPNVLVSSSPPRGIYDAMNRACELATSQWLWFINAGDVLVDDDSLSLISQLILLNSDVGIIATPVIQATPSGYFYSFTSPVVELVDEQKFAIFHHQGCLINRKKFIDLGGYDSNLKYAADGKLLDSIISRSEFHLINSPFIIFQLGGRSWSNLAETLKEIRTYRVLKTSYIQEKILLFKNKLRYFTLPIDPNFIVRIYLSYRQKKMLEVSPWKILKTTNRKASRMTPLFIDQLGLTKKYYD
jgi:glycosyltransferase involved in cell wall biosynthesis